MTIFNTLSEEEVPTPDTTSGGSDVESNKRKGGNTLSSAPFKTPAPESTLGPACIGKPVRIIGQIYSKEEMYVDGEVEGTIEAQAHRLTIGPNGRLRCHVKAREVVTFGDVQGKVDANDKVEVRKDASVVGDITAGRIMIEDGAYFKGNVDVVKHEPAKSFAGFQPESRVMPFLVTTPSDAPECAHDR